MKKVEIFDPAMCCSTGVCGPSVDPELTRVASAVHLLESSGIEIKRYQLTNDPDKFADNSTVSSILHEKGTDALPITLVNGEIVQTGSYPTNEDLAKWLNVKLETLQAKPKSKLSINLNSLN
ncbi:arsenite efflux transporter metallochaperone ArsD [Bacillus solimangrovi]|uniref:Transcriptional regulator n=1 Tax=Bacillus solimangrovi TaxID=1305675 RepID=A0A1E5LJX0_9BACI|nr:arsenite efflux transporter metallochaperone ArsD [Bacillus solimangrovi]OEH94399.1 transcriptional regulator [Bacillus solimangrovi]